MWQPFNATGAGMISFMIALLAVCASAGLVGGLVFKKKALQKKRKTLLASDVPQDWIFFIDKNIFLRLCVIAFSPENNRYHRYKLHDMYRM